MIFHSDTIRPNSWNVAVVDDDHAVLASLSRLLTARGCTVHAFSSADALLGSLPTSSFEVLITDLRLEDTDGLTLQATIRRRGYRIPTVFLSGHGDVSTSVRAIHDGAIDFLEKPCDEETLLRALGRAIGVARRDRARESAIRELTESYRTLTPREREVFDWVVTGCLNKQIAAAIGTTEKTVKVHRARVMAKMRASSLASLVRMFDALDDAAAQDSADVRTALPASAGMSYRRAEGHGARRDQHSPIAIHGKLAMPGRGWPMLHERVRHGSAARYAVAAEGSARLYVDAMAPRRRSGDGRP